MMFIFILIVLMFSLLFILKAEKADILRNISLLTMMFPLILAILLLISATYDSGVTGFTYLGMFDVQTANVPVLIKTFASVSLISIMLYFYSLTRY